MAMRSEFNNLKYQICLEQSLSSDVQRDKAWLTKTLGPKRSLLEDIPGKWDVRWKGYDYNSDGLSSEYVWSFETEEDMTLFALRWTKR
jgi:hypothetical protein